MHPEQDVPWEDDELRAVIEAALRDRGLAFPPTDEDIQRFIEENDPMDLSSDLLERVLERIQREQLVQEGETEADAEPPYPWMQFEDDGQDGEEEARDREELMALFRKGSDLDPSTRKEIEEEMRDLLREEDEDEEEE